MVECVDLVLCAEDAVNIFGFFKEDIKEEQKSQSNVIKDFLVLSDDEFQMLLEKEIQCIPGRSYVQCYRNQSLDIDSRFKAISWILKMHGLNRFRALTAYRSMNYWIGSCSSILRRKGMDDAATGNGMPVIGSKDERDRGAVSGRVAGGGSRFYVRIQNCAEDVAPHPLHSVVADALCYSTFIP